MEQWRSSSPPRSPGSPRSGSRAQRVGSLAGVLFVSIPACSTALARELEVSVADLVASLRGWALRFAVAAAVCVLASRAIGATGSVAVAAAGGVVAIAYGALMLPLALEDPLGPYVRSTLCVDQRFLGRTSYTNHRAASVNTRSTNTLAPRTPAPSTLAPGTLAPGTAGTRHPGTRHPGTPAPGTRHLDPWHIVTGEYPPARGGVSDYTFAIANGLASAGDEVNVWCPGPPVVPTRIRGASCRIRSCIRRQRSGLVTCHGPSTAGSWTCAAIWSVSTPHSMRYRRPERCSSSGCRTPSDRGRSTCASAAGSAAARAVETCWT